MSPAGDRVRFAYDARGLLLSRSSPDGTVSDLYAYDAFGRQTVARNAETTLSYAYDPLDRIVAERDPRFGAMQFAHDPDGRIVQVVYPKSAAFPEGAAVRYDFDARDQIVAVTDPMAGTWQVAWDELGRQTSVLGPKGSRRDVSYTEAGFVDAVVVRIGAETETLQYGAYDGVGNPGTITTSGTIDQDEGTTSLAYDDLHRVVSATYLAPDLLPGPWNRP